MKKESVRERKETSSFQGSRGERPFDEAGTPPSEDYLID
jgi:hypothetical protein